jgi:hypothetical protein
MQQSDGLGHIPWVPRNSHTNWTAGAVERGHLPSGPCRVDTIPSGTAPGDGPELTGLLGRHTGGAAHASTPQPPRPQHRPCLPAPRPPTPPVPPGSRHVVYPGGVDIAPTIRREKDRLSPVRAFESPEAGLAAQLRVNFLRNSGGGAAESPSCLWADKDRAHERSKRQLIQVTHNTIRRRTENASSPTTVPDGC